MPKVSLEKLLDLLRSPEAGPSSHLFLTLEPVQAFAALAESAGRSLKGTETVYYDGALCGLSKDPLFPLGTELRLQLKNPALQKVYPAHRPLWEGLFEDTNQARTEPLILSEATWELSRLHGDFAGFWEQCPPRKRIIFVDDVSRLSPELWRSLTLGLPTPKDQIWVWHLPKDHQCEDSREKAAWERFLRTAENRLFQYLVTDVPVEIRKREEPRSPDFLQLLDLLDRAMFFMDIHQAKILGEAAVQHLVSDPELSKRHSLRVLSLLFTFGELQMLAGDLDRALTVFHQALSLAQEQKNSQAEVKALARLSLVHQGQNHFSRVEQSLSEAWSQALLLGDEDLKAEVLFAYLNHSLDENFVLLNHEHFLSLRDYLAGRGWKNHLAVLLTSIAFLNATREKASLTQAVSYCEEGISLAQELQNKHLLSQGYHGRGVIAQNEGNYTQAMELYQKSEKIRRNLGDKLELIKICNGTGFFSMITQQFDTALDYYSKALKLLEQHRDFRELGMTLFNMGMTYFFTFQYDKAQIFFQNLLTLMNLLEMENLPFQSRRQIHSVLGLCQWKEGRSQEAWQSFYRAEQYVEVDDPLHRFFFYMLKAQLTASVEDWNQSFAQAKQKHYAIISYYFAAEWGVFNRDILKSGRQVQIWEEALGGISLFEGNFYSQKFQDLLENRPSPVPNWKQKLPEFATLLEIVGQEKTILSLQKKVEELRFVSNLQTHLQGAKNQDALLGGVLSLIRQDFILETGVVVLRTKDGGFQNAASFALPVGLDPLGLHQLLFTHSSAQYFPQVSGVKGLQDLKDQIQSLIFLPLVHNDHYLGGMILGSVTRTLGLSREDLTPLSIAASQTAAALDFLQVQDRLHALQPKDDLTGLPSIQELRRRPLKDKTGVLYIHLDNFRTYNDRYGRAVGDLLLQKFAGLLHIASRQEDLVVRYGGVEFVILVPDTGVEGAKKLALRILKEMENRKSFQDALETFLGRALEVTDVEKLSCSIGVAEMLGALSMEEALARVKNEGKGNYFIL